MSIIFAYVPSAYKAGTTYTAIPNDGTADFSCSRPVAADRIDPNGNVESMGVNVPRIDYAGGGCPVLLTDSGDAITNAAVSFDSSLGVFTIDTTILNQTSTNAVTLSNGTDKHIAFNFDFDDNTLGLNISNAGGTSLNEVFNVDLSVGSVVQVSWQGNDLEFKNNYVLLYKLLSFTSFGSSDLTKVNLSNTAGNDFFLYARTKEVKVDSDPSSIDTSFKTWEEVVTATKYINL